MPFTESMIYRAAKSVADNMFRKATAPNDEAIGAFESLFGGYAHVGQPLQKRCFVTTQYGVVSDVEMVKCEYCEMWNPMGHVCPCKWLPESTLAKKEKEVEDETAYEAELVEPPKEEMVPCPCLRVVNLRQRRAYGTKFTCAVCKGKLVIPKSRQ